MRDSSLSVGFSSWKKKAVGLITCALCLFPLPALAGTFLAFGPESYTRTTESPVTVSQNFTVLNPNTRYTLQIHNGGMNAGEFEKVSSALVMLNGVQIATPNEFNQNVSLIEKPVTLTQANRFSIELRGKPGGGLTVQIIGEDSDPPLITITSPSNGAVVVTPSISITGTVSDAISGASTVSCNSTQAILSDSSFACDVSLVEGSNDIIVVAEDRAGNRKSEQITVIRGDNDPPQVALNPTDGSTINTTTPLIQITYSDQGSGIDLLSLIAKIDGLDATNAFTITQEGASYLAPLSGGQHTIEASIKDKFGNLTQAASKFTISVFRALPDATPRNGTVPLTVTFVTKGEYTDGAITRYRWDFQGDGIFDTSEPGARNRTFTFTRKGTFNAVLEILNDKNQTTQDSVTITVAGNPPTATGSVNPSNGATPLLVNFTGSGSDSDGTIAKYEWDFEGDGVFDYESTTTGNTNHTYSAEGIFNALFRVTDNDGLTATARVTATAVRVGPAGSPTATITAPSNLPTGNAPLTVSFNGTGTDPDGTIAQFEWDFDGDGVFDFSSATSAASSFQYNSPGIFTSVLRVTDNSGLTGIDTVDVTVNIAATLAVPNDTCRPLRGETITVNTTLGGTTPVSILLKDKGGQLVRNLVNNVTRTAGPYADIWDCKDNNGAIVKEGVYYAILQYQAGGEIRTVDLTNTTGGVIYNPDRTIEGQNCFSCSYVVRPFEDDPLDIEFIVPSSRGASEVSATIIYGPFQGAEAVVTLLDHKAFGVGTYSLKWDGFDASNKLTVAPLGKTLSFGILAFTLPNNAIFVETAPQLSNVTIDPNYFDPATGDFISPTTPPAKVSYELSKEANVIVQVFNTSTNRLVRTITKSNVPGGTDTIEWDGRNDTGIFVDKGDYRLSLKATDVSGNQSLVRHVLVRVFY